VLLALISVLGLVIVMAFVGMFTDYDIRSAKPTKSKKLKPPKPTKQHELPRAIARKKKA
jgi:hypothetical protein